MKSERYTPFGERIGAVPTVDLPLNEISPQFRQALANLVHPIFERRDGPATVGASAFWRRMASDKRWDMDAHRYSPNDVCTTVIKRWLQDSQTSEWHEIYDFIEHFPRWARMDAESVSFWEERLNEFLLKERSPYRFVGHQLTPITSAEEQREAAEAAGLTGRYASASNHLQKALVHFAARPSPDYENACKEAASAVEAALNIANGKTSAVGDAVKTFAKVHSVHTALMDSASKLFGYASDRDGVRHASKSASTPVDYAEAKLVIVSASTWVNFIVTRSP